jgi:hypothetical protein
VVDGQIVEVEPRRSQLGLIRQHLGGPLSRDPDPAITIANTTRIVSADGMRR